MSSKKIFATLTFCVQRFVALAALSRTIKLTAPSLLVCTLAMLFSLSSEAVIVTGRFTAGAYAASENFSNTTVGSPFNDFLVGSARIYLKLQRVGALDITFDIRDKNDFFDKLDRERLTLTNSNELQVREANAHYAGHSGFYTTFGRFSLSEAGSVFVDGAEAGDHLNSNLRFAAFAGHSPKRPEDAYLHSDTPDIVYGTYLTYQPKLANWQRIFSLSSAFVNTMVERLTERSYFFSNMLYQWNPRSRVISNVYLDFTPRTYVQNAFVVYQQGITSRFGGTLQGLAYDTFEYSRRTGLLETLPSSPYREASLSTRLLIQQATQWLTQFRYGERTVDKMNRKEGTTGVQVNGILSSKMDVVVSGGYRKDFTASGPMTRIEANYYSAKVELGFSVDAAIENNAQPEIDGPKVLHPVTTEFSMGTAFNRAIFGAVSLQYAQDEVVKIVSTYLNLTYRYGSQDIAPIRDGTPPRRPW